MALEDIRLIIIAITALFFVLLAIKGRTKRNFCVLCASISITWLVLFILYWLGYYENTLILGILMGESITGIFYLAEKNIRKEFHLFRLPFILTLTLMAYVLLATSVPAVSVIVYLAALWALFIIFYISRLQGRISQLVKKIIECCKNW